MGVRWLSYADVARHIALHGLERRAAQHVEEEGEGFGGFEEFGGGDGVVLALVHGHVGEGLLAVEEGAARGKGHGGWRGCTGRCGVEREDWMCINILW